MDNPILENIVTNARVKLLKEYGCVGVANGPENAMLDCTDKNGKTIKIIIKVEE